MPETEMIYDQYKDLVFGYLIRLCRNRDLVDGLSDSGAVSTVRESSRPRAVMSSCWMREQSSTGLCSSSMRRM